MPATPTKALETFANPSPDRDYTIRLQIPEFTCLCPRTGQPDFATLDLEYVPDRVCVELKSLKLYIWSFRDRGAYHEAVTNEIADHLDATLPLTSRELPRSGPGLSTRTAPGRFPPANPLGPELAPIGEVTAPVQPGDRRYNRAFFKRLMSI
jgi:7-cyano-7-deazaguanine reductase